MNNDDGKIQAQKALDMPDGEMVNETGTPGNIRQRKARRTETRRRKRKARRQRDAEARRQRDQCYMLLMKALYRQDLLVTTVDLEKITLRSGVPLLMLPNGWVHVNELAQGEHGLREKYIRNQRWKIRAEFSNLNPFTRSERGLGDKIDWIFNNWDPNDIMTPEQQKEFASRAANMQKEVVHKKVAERAGILASQLNEDKKTKLEDIVRAIQSFLRAGVPNPFAVEEIQKAITELGSDLFAMDGLKLLVEDMYTKATDEFSVKQLTAIFGELNVAAEADKNNGAGTAESNSSVQAKTQHSSDMMRAGPGVNTGEGTGEKKTIVLTFRGR